jgi:hypothetical protein
VSEKPVVNLYDLDGIGIIIMFPSGVIYSNQTGGHSCLHPEEEGVFLPLSYELIDQQEMLQKHFAGPKWRSGCANGIDADTADFVDHVLHLSSTTGFVEVDRSRLSNSHEAWIYVKLELSSNKSGIIRSFQNGVGVLTWSNSD